MAQSPKIAASSRAKKPMSKGAKLAIIAGSIVVVLFVAAVIVGVVFAAPALNFLHSNGVKVDEKGSSIEVTTDDGQGTFSSKAELPKNYPSDIPVYPGSEVMYSVVKDGQGSNVTLRSADGQQQVVSYYESQLAEKGWSKTRDQATYFNSGIGFAEKPLRNLALIVTSEERDGKASTVIVVTEKVGE